MEVKMAQKKVCDKEFKVQTVKLGREIGFSKAGGCGSTLRNFRCISHSLQCVLISYVS